MKKISFDVVFKIVVLLLLSIILIICFNESESESSNYQQQEPTEVGRYKEIKVKTTGIGGREQEHVLILDTKTGETKYPN